MGKHPHASALAADLLAALDPAALCAKVGMVPDPWQLQVLRSGARRLCLVCARQVGKSTVASILAVHAATYTPGSLVLVVAPSLRQSSELFRASLSLYRALGRPVIAEQENATSLVLENGSRLVSLPGDERTVRGYSGARLVVIDEAARVEDELLAAVMPMVAISGGRLLALSTPWGRRGWFWEASNDPAWEVVTVTARECPRWSPEAIAEFRDSRGDLAYRSELACEFVDAAGRMFATEDVDAAFESGELDATDLAPLFGHSRLPLPRSRPEVLPPGERPAALAAGGAQ